MKVSRIIGIVLSAIILLLACLSLARVIDPMTGLPVILGLFVAVNFVNAYRAYHEEKKSQTVICVITAIVIAVILVTGLLLK